jgi:hypothetical protein
VLLDAREQLLSGRSSLERRSVKGFRDIVREVHDFGTVPPRALQAAPPTREAYEEEAIEPILDRHDLYWFELDTPQQRDREDAYAPDDGRLIALPQVRATRGTAPEAERSLSYGALATLLMALIMVVGSAGAVFWMACDFGVVRFPQSLWREYAKSGQPQNDAGATQIIWTGSAAAE